MIPGSTLPGTQTPVKVEQAKLDAQKSKEAYAPWSRFGGAVGSNERLWFRLVRDNSGFWCNLGPRGLIGVLCLVEKGSRVLLGTSPSILQTLHPCSLCFVCCRTRLRM